MKLRSRIAWGLASVLAAFAIGTACKPASTSEVQSLDNFAAGKDLHRNQCRAPQSSFSDRYAVARTVPVATGGTMSKEKAEAITKVVHETLTALPEPLIRAFKAGGGRFVLDPNAKKNCSKMARTYGIASPNDMESCQYYLQQKETGLMEVLVVMPPEKELIQHNVVKSVGYSLSQIMAHLRIKEGQKGFVLDSGKNEAIDTMGQQLMRAFLMDVGTFAHKGMFESLALRYFNLRDPNGLGEYIADSKAAELITGETSKDILDFFQFKSKAKRSDMQDWLFAHTLDSAYCNRSASYDRDNAFKALFDGEKLSSSQRNAYLKNTYAVMKDYFPFTAETHRRWEKELFKFAEFLEIQNPSGGNSSQRSGFELTDTDPEVEGRIDEMMASAAGRRFLEQNPSFNRMIGTESNPGARRMIEANSDDWLVNTYGTSTFWNDGPKQVAEDRQMAAYPAWAKEQVTAWNAQQSRIAAESRARDNASAAEAQKLADTKRAVNDPAFFRDTYMPTYMSKIAALNNSSTQQQGGMEGQSSGYAVGASGGYGSTGGSGSASGSYNSSQASGTNWASGQQQAGVGVNAATYEQNAYADWYKWRQEWGPVTNTPLSPSFGAPVGQGGINGNGPVAGPAVSGPVIGTGTNTALPGWTAPAPQPAKPVTVNNIDNNSSTPSQTMPPAVLPMGAGGVVTSSAPAPAMAPPSGSAADMGGAGNF